MTLVAVEIIFMIFFLFFLFRFFSWIATYEVYICFKFLWIFRIKRLMKNLNYLCLLVMDSGTLYLTRLISLHLSLSLSLSHTHTHTRMCTTILAIITFFSTHQEERALSILRLIHWIDLRLEHLIKRMGLHVPLILQYPLLHACHTC